jgi:hypothetical protein
MATFWLPRGLTGQLGLRPVTRSLRKAKVMADESDESKELADKYQATEERSGHPRVLRRLKEAKAQSGREGLDKRLSELSQKMDEIRREGC